MNKRIRKPEISILNVLFCLVVIFIHIISYSLSEFPVNTAGYNISMILWRLASFVVQGFILLSGVKLFLNGKEKLSYGKYLAARFKGIVLPYIFCYAIYYIVYMIVAGYKFDVLYILKSLLLGEIWGHFYFIVIIVQFDLLFPLWKKVIPRCSPILVISFATAFTFMMEMCFPIMLKAIFPQLDFMYNDRLFTTYLVYWLIGCYVGRYYDDFKELLNKNFVAICVLCGLSTVLMVVFSYITYTNLAWIPCINTIHGMYVLSICLLLYAVALKLPQEIYEKLKLVSLLDKSSFYIYLYHILVLLFADKVIGYLGFSSQLTTFAIRCLIVYTITPALCIVYVKLKKRFLSKIRCKS